MKNKDEEVNWPNPNLFDDSKENQIIPILWVDDAWKAVNPTASEEAYKKHYESLSIIRERVPYHLLDGE